MLISPSKKYVIRVEDLGPIKNRIKSLSPTCIMNNKLMTRTIFEVPGKDTMWLRVRTGDVDCAYNPITTASLLDKTSHEKGSYPVKKSIDLQLTDYYNDVAFFQNMGLPVVSEQETRRTKWICHYDGIKYTICFDVWPLLSEQIFISITPATNADDDDLEGFINFTGVKEYSLDDFPTDVDDAFSRVTGKTARAYRYLRFDSRFVTTHAI